MEVLILNGYYGNLIKKLKGRRLSALASGLTIRGQGKNLVLRVTESAVFLRRFVKTPRQVGSVIPSSPYLTRAMMSKIKWDEARYVAELGAGTGVFTRAIVRNLEAERAEGAEEAEGKVFVFEIDPALRAMIEKEHPNLTVYGDARELRAIIEAQGVQELDYVVSSLPFAVLPPRVTAAILEAVDKCLKPGGKFIAYQYSKHMKPYFEKRFGSVKISFVLRNVPPAFVYECTRKPGKFKKEFKKECKEEYKEKCTKN
jgi:phospholipid N-methyltransferase